MSSSRRSGASGGKSSSSRSSSRAPPPPPPPPAEEEDTEPQEATENGNGAPEPSAQSQSSSRGPMPVGRSLEIAGTPDVCMDMLVDKLKLLNYEQEFCRKKKPYRKPLTRQYFSVAMVNSSEQFFYFAGLATWLLSQAGQELPNPKEFDDPNTICMGILGAAKKLGFANPSYHATKLTQGNGKDVCGVLDGLVDYVLELQKFQYKRPVYAPEGPGGSEEAVDDDAETAAMEGNDEMARPDPRYNDDGEEEEAYMDPSRSGAGETTTSDEVSDKQVLHSKVDPTLWKIELERVAPRLRITLAADAKDWRSHLDEAHEHQETINKVWPDSKAALERLRMDVNASMDRLINREKFLNEKMEDKMLLYRGASLNLQEVQDTYNKKSELVSDRHSELNRIAEQLDDIKSSMDEKGSNIADATPVVRIKNASKKLNEELHDMEVRIGVVSHTLLQLSMKNKRLMQAAQAASVSDDDED